MKKFKSKQMFTYALVLCLLATALVYMFVYKKNVEKTEALRTSNDTLEERVNSLKVYQDKKAYYLAEMEPMREEIETILAKYPADSREENVLMQAMTTHMLTPIIYSKININAKEDMKVIPRDVVMGAGVEKYEVENQTDVVFESREATFANKVNYTSMKAAIQAIFDSEDVIGIKKITYVDTEAQAVAYKVNLGDQELGDNISDVDMDEVSLDDLTFEITDPGRESLLEGTIDVVYYSVEGTGKEYVAPDMNPYLSGVVNIFGNFELEEDESNGSLTWEETGVPQE